MPPLLMRTHQLILTLHGIGTPGPRPLEHGEGEVWISEADFLDALDACVGHPEILITSDDGNSSDATIALPALVERGLDATFFVLVDRIDTPGSLSRTQLSELLAAGMRIGSHGAAHRSWRHMPSAVAQQEIVGAKERLEQIVGRPVTEAACPFGDYDRTCLRRLKLAGFQRAYSSDGGWASSLEWLGARNTLHTGDGPTFVNDLLQSPMRSPRHLARRCKQLIKRWR